MREILFRGREPILKNLPTVKIWAYGQLVERDDYCCIFEGKDTMHESDYPYLNSAIGWIDGCLTPVIPETVGQFTGLLDKNGKKIFEGDVIKFHKYRGEPDWVGVVKYEHCLYMVTGTMPLAYEKRIGEEPYFCPFEVQLSGIDKNTIEVIGNIHDNPELLTKS